MLTTRSLSPFVLHRYMPPIAKLLSIVDAGSLGKLHMVHIREHRFPFLLKVGVATAQGLVLL